MTTPLILPHISVFVKANILKATGPGEPGGNPADLCQGFCEGCWKVAERKRITGGLCFRRERAPTIEE